MEEETLNDESLLWNSFLSGDSAAGSQIYRQYVQILFKYGLQFTSDRELVKDCIQDLFEKIHKNRNRLLQTGNIKLYLFIILKNGLINALKRKRRHVEVSGLEEYEFAALENPGENPLILKEERQETEERIRLAFSCLTARQKEALYYRFVECMGVGDIAKLMEINYQSAKNLIQRSIRKIKSETGS